jgi:DMSO/TMAO reductase YedYZ heme-binding membrane subunit
MLYEQYQILDEQAELWKIVHHQISANSAEFVNPGSKSTAAMFLFLVCLFFPILTIFN